MMRVLIAFPCLVLNPLTLIHGFCMRLTITRGDVPKSVNRAAIRTTRSLRLPTGGVCIIHATLLLHCLFDASPNEPPVGRVAGRKAKRHANLHAEPVDRAFGMELVMKQHETGKGHPAEETNLKALRESVSALTAARTPSLMPRPRMVAIAKS